MSGYLPEEVVGVDAFTYMHQEDAKWAQVALQYSEYPCSSYTLPFGPPRKVYLLCLHTSDTSFVAGRVQISTCCTNVTLMTLPPLLLQC